MFWYFTSYLKLKYRLGRVSPSHFLQNFSIKAVNILNILSCTLRFLNVMKIRRLKTSANGIQKFAEKGVLRELIIFAWNIYLQPSEVSELTPGSFRSGGIASSCSRGKALRKFCKTVPPRHLEILFLEAWVA